MKSDISPIKVTHYGKVHFGADVECEALVLENGERGFNRKQVTQVFGLHRDYKGGHFRHFIAEITPNSLDLMDKKGWSVIMPSGQRASFIPCDVIPDFAAGVIRQAVAGTLHSKRKGLIEPCLRIQESLSKVGITALIDEATGYQHHRAPDHLQVLFDKLLRQTASDWERRFHPDYYESVYRLFRWTYNPAKPKPHIVGKITLMWVYEPVFPVEILTEIKERQRSEKMHQWLETGGIKLLEKQISAVTMIARSSIDHKDFSDRCAIAFFKRGQMPILYPREI